MAGAGWLWREVAWGLWRDGGGEMAAAGWLRQAVGGGGRQAAGGGGAVPAARDIVRRGAQRRPDGQRCFGQEQGWGRNIGG